MHSKLAIKPEPALHARAEPGCACCRPSQFAEETKQADKVVPWGFVIGAALTTVMGFGFVLVVFHCVQACEQLRALNAGHADVRRPASDLLMGLFIAVQDIGLDALMGGEANGYVMGQILFDIMKASCQLFKYLAVAA
jgi:hypothetical protein